MSTLAYGVMSLLLLNPTNLPVSGFDESPTDQSQFDQDFSDARQITTEIPYTYQVQKHRSEERVQEYTVQVPRQVSKWECIRRRWRCVTRTVYVAETRTRTYTVQVPYQEQMTGTRTTIAMSYIPSAADKSKSIYDSQTIDLMSIPAASGPTKERISLAVANKSNFGTAQPFSANDRNVRFFTRWIPTATGKQQRGLVRIRPAGNDVQVSWQVFALKPGVSPTKQTFSDIDFDTVDSDMTTFHGKLLTEVTNLVIAPVN